MQTTGVTARSRCVCSLHVSLASSSPADPRATGAQDAFCRWSALGATVAARCRWPRKNTTRRREACEGSHQLPSPATSNTPSTTQTWKWTCSFRLETEPVNEGHCADVQVRLVHALTAPGCGSAEFVRSPERCAAPLIQRGLSLRSQCRSRLGTESTTGAPAGGGRRGQSGAPSVSTMRRWCTRGRTPGLLEKAVISSCARSRRSERRAKPWAKMPPQDILPTTRTRGAWVCGGRPGRRTDLRWPTLAKVS